MSNKCLQPAMGRIPLRYIFLISSLFINSIICYDQLGLIISANCPANRQMVTFQSEYRLSMTDCDEVAEFNAIAQLHVFSQYRVIILVVSFSANCRAVGIAEKRIREPTAIFLIGCEEISFMQLNSSPSSKVVVIQMSVPSWYPARIFQHIAMRQPDEKSALIGSRSCAEISSSILRGYSQLVAHYYSLDADLKSLIADYSRPYICLGLEELNDPYDLSGISERRKTFFINNAVTKSEVVTAIENSKLMDIIALDRSRTLPTSFVTYTMDDDNLMGNVLTDFEKSLMLGKALMDHAADSRETSRDFISQIAVILIEHENIAKLFRVDRSFVQLYDWSIEFVEISENGTTFNEKLRVSVDHPWRRNFVNGSNITADILSSTIGFEFIELYDWATETKIQQNANSQLVLSLAVGISSFVLVVGVLILVALYRQRYVKSHFSKERVKFYIDAEDLTPISKRTNTQLSISSNNNSKSTNGMNGHVHHGDVGKSFLSVRTTDSEVNTELGLAAGDNYAKFNGEIVFLRHIRTKNMSLKSATRRLVSVMRDLRADNLNGFVAYFIGNAVPFRPPAVVFEYCPRGSLMDLIDKEEIKLDWSFKLSFLGDIVRGLKAIHHSPLKFHGRLTSRKCVIDNRWTLKITDYAVYRLELHQNGEKPTEEHASPESLLWTAPEVLRNQLLSEGTSKGDIYSFAVIMQELILRGRPFCTTDLSPKEIIQKVRHPPPLLRPQVPNQSAQPEALMIMKECWNENPEIRPNIDEVVVKFKALNQGRKTNIVDSMFQMLEKYSNNLEELIHERTEELNEEKKKTEQLLYRMMPQSVAEKLKLGQPVEPENFAEVTIYFSDIVGFTTISAYSTPMEIVNLLNDLYSVFDTTLSYYDVYKVETIGDAYMVVSGLPIANGNKHAGEIASVALDLLYQCGKFKIRHLSEVPLLLRIGIHTGSCAAGVVGLTMPRYCLFGDTVNTASRMESTSRAYRIHLSDTTYGRLQDVGGFKMEFRGMTLVKGKGELPTYWLEGKEGFNKPLPMPAPDVGENHGLSEAIIIRGRELQMAIDLKAGFKQVDGMVFQTDVPESQERNL